VGELAVGTVPQDRYLARMADVLDRAGHPSLAHLIRPAQQGLPVVLRAAILFLRQQANREPETFWGRPSDAGPGDRFTLCMLSLETALVQHGPRLESWLRPPPTFAPQRKAERTQPG